MHNITKRIQYHVCQIVHSSVCMDNGQVVQAGIWNVCSQTGLSEDGYSVTEKNGVCSQSVCHIKCSRSECGSLCRHMYDCECYDYANGHICKHIHAVRIHNHMRATSDEANATEACATPVFNTASDKENTLPGEVYTCTCIWLYAYACIYMLYIQ